MPQLHFFKAIQCPLQAQATLSSPPRIGKSSSRQRIKSDSSNCLITSSKKSWAAESTSIIFSTKFTVPASSNQPKSNEREIFTLVYPEEENVKEKMLSILAPIGTAILGYRVGDTVSWPVPVGRRRVKIASIVYQPEHYQR